ncbi:hypothetical protein SFR_3725 [Streptomyces sp. FR-008]|nr:hypothetical protein SFR_3725 [Streptomyces sp. FR-008]
MRRQLAPHGPLEPAGGPEGGQHLDRYPAPVCAAHHVTGP